MDNPCQLGPSGAHKLVYLATDSQQQRQVVKFTQGYGREAHGTWAGAGIAPKLLAQPYQVAKTWQQISMEYLAPEMSDSSGCLTMRFLMQSHIQQVEHAPESLTLAPHHLPQLIDRAKRLVLTAYEEFTGMRFAHGDARPDNIMIRIKDNAVLDLRN